MDLIDGKIILQKLESDIKDLEDRLRIIKSSRSQISVWMCEHVLNQAAACDRDCCCGSRPRQLMFSVLDCEKSPVGTCVYSQRPDPDHKNCLFCHLAEDRD